MQQRELLGGQVDALFAAIGPVPTLIQFEVRYFQYLWHRHLLAAAQQGTHPSQQLGELEWLDQIVIRPQVQPPDLVGQAPPGGQHHYPGVATLADQFQHAPAIDLGQIHVQYHQVIGLLPGQVKSIRTGRGTIHDITTFTQTLMQVLGGF
ncbi:hypothetical protein D3C78_1381660 [compost metagenome]